MVPVGGGVVNLPDRDPVIPVVAVEGPGIPDPCGHRGGVAGSAAAGGRRAFGGLAASQVAGLAVGDEPVRAGGGQVRLAVVAGVGDEDADLAGHGVVAGGVVAGIVSAISRTW
jgi:hypothetical protein